MIVDAILIVFSAIISTILQLLPEATLPTEITDLFTQFSAGFGFVGFALPVGTILTVLGLFVTIEGILLVWRLFRLVWKLFRGG